MRLLASQALGYFLATVGMRYVANGSALGVCISDAMLATIGFYSVNEVARGRGTMLHYVAGSVLGGLAGMLV